MNCKFVGRRLSFLLCLLKLVQSFLTSATYISAAPPLISMDTVDASSISSRFAPASRAFFIYIVMQYSHLAVMAVPNAINSFVFVSRTPGSSTCFMKSWKCCILFLFFLDRVFNRITAGNANAKLIILYISFHKFPQQAGGIAPL